MIAAAAFAYVAGKKVAGLYDHAAGRDLQVAAEFQGKRFQGLDGDRAVRFGGSVPELYDGGAGTFISFEVDGTIVRGYDRSSSSFYEAHVVDGVVQVHDHSHGAWFAYDVQDANSARSYYRST
jgi:hypothetical protein